MKVEAKEMVDNYSDPIGGNFSIVVNSYPQ